MKNIIKRIAPIVLLLIAFSCADNTLDPLQFDFVKKGVILALRGEQLQNIYFNGEPGAEFVPLIATGEETFDFDAELLAQDPSVLESFDIYVIKGTGASRERVHLTNVPASAFKSTDDYRNPWVSVSLKLKDIVAALGLGPFPLSSEHVQELVTTYKFGVNIEIDLNLKDGSKVLAEDLVASGLYQSNQFYPAQKLNYAVINFCAYDAPSWAGTYTANEIYSNSAYGPYEVTLSPDLLVENRFWLDNFWDYGMAAYIDFTPSTNPDDQIVVFPEQTVDGATLTGSGTYDQCTNKLKIQTSYAGYEWRYEFAKN